MVKRPDDSSEQRTAEEWLRAEARGLLGVELIMRRLDLEEGKYLLLDGYSGDSAVLCKIWAHIGPPKSAQINKVMKDALKMVFVRQQLGVDARCVLVFADEEAARPLKESTWRSDCLPAIKVDIMVIPLTGGWRDDVVAAQKRQYR